MTNGEPNITFRRAMSGAWIWELVSSDGHVCNRSAEFESRAEAQRDAIQCGQTEAGAE